MNDARSKMTIIEAPNCTHSSLTGGSFVLCYCKPCFISSRRWKPCRQAVSVAGMWKYWAIMTVLIMCRSRSIMSITRLSCPVNCPWHAGYMPSNYCSSQLIMMYGDCIDTALAANLTIPRQHHYNIVQYLPLSLSHQDVVNRRWSVTRWDRRKSRYFQWCL